MTARFEVACTDDGYTARFVSNGRTILSSGAQVYRRRRDAVRAVELIAETFGGWLTDGAMWTYVDDSGRIGERRIHRAEVRNVDERGQ